MVVGLDWLLRVRRVLRSTAMESVPVVLTGPLDYNEPMKRLTYHPACLLFPGLRKEELRELADNIKRNGLLHDIILLNGQILDGRNRYLACGIAGVEPKFVEWQGSGSPTEWVISENLIRRHLTSSQRAVIAHDLLPLLEREAKEQQKLSPGRGKKVSKKLDTFSHNGAASHVAARIAKTNSAYVQAVKVVEKQAPELIEEIRSGNLNVPDAVTLAKLSKSKRQNVLRRLGAAGPEQKLKRVIREAELDCLKRQSANGNTSSRKGELQVWCGDCLSLLPQRIKDKTISVAVTSPPFNLGVRYNR